MINKMSPTDIHRQITSHPEEHRHQRHRPTHPIGQRDGHVHQANQDVRVGTTFHPDRPGHT